MIRNEEEQGPIAASAERRRFLRNALRMGGATALLLTSASREVLARSLSLSAQDLEVARRARPAAAGSKAVPPVESVSRGGCDGCEGGCTGSCSGGCTSCTGSCTGGCASGCTGANS